MPEGFYVPVDPQVKKKRNTTPIIISVSVCLVFSLLFSIAAVGFVAPVDKASDTSKWDYTANATMRKAVISSALDLYNISWRTNIPLTK